MIFDVLADAGRNFNVTTSVLKPHDCGFPSHPGE